MSATIELSYIIATRNRLPFLKIIIDRLLNELQPDEEIVIVDGNSIDGTKDYLQLLFEQGKIHQYISEPDHNQAHAWNKAMLVAKGTIIKKLIDDDVFSYSAIRSCKDFMLANPDVDVCISNCLVTQLNDPGSVSLASRLSQFNDWRAEKTTCFTFSDVYMLIRRSVLSYLGLYDTQFTMLDWEYSLRCSYLRSKIAYYTACNALAVSTPNNVTSNATALMLKAEEKIGKVKYGYPGDAAFVSNYSKLKIAVGKTIKYKKGGTANSQIEPTNLSLTETYDALYKRLENHNNNCEKIFLT